MTDKIDRIVEKEIPEVLDETTTLEENINQPAAESNGINLIGSDGLNSPTSIVTPRSSVKTIEGKADKSLAEDIDYILDDDMPPAECNGQSSPSSDVIPRSSTKRNKAKKEAKDNKLESDIQNIVSKRKPDAKSNGTSLSIAGAAPGPKAIYAKRKNKKIDDKEQVLEEVLRSYFKQ